MKTTLSTTEAAHRLIDDNNANWSYAGAVALVEYLEELEEDIGEEIEFCPVAIRCDYSEYSDLQEWGGERWYLDSDMRSDLNLEIDDDPDDAIREFIQYHGTLIEFDGGIIVSSF
jgi:hypothetical protein